MYNIYEISGLILGFHPTNERRRYIGWAQTSLARCKPRISPEYDMRYNLQQKLFEKVNIFTYNNLQPAIAQIKPQLGTQVIFR